MACLANVLLQLWKKEMSLTAYFSHPDCLKHDMGTHHPECPERLTAIRDQLMSSLVFDFLNEQTAPEISAEALARVHTPAYLADLERLSPDCGLQEIAPDTMLNQDSLLAARRAAGAVVAAVDLVCAGGAPNAFCAIRPPGHHASADQSMGFCFYNNVSVGVAHALAVHGLQRVAVVDFDVHHGNGTADIWANDGRVQMLSFYQDGLFPDSVANLGDAPNLHHTPLPAGAGGREFRELVLEAWLPLLHDFQPEMIFISAGFDAHAEDDMAQINLKEADYAWVTKHLMAVAQQYSQGRIVSVLEGGYELSALARSVLAHIKVLSE